MNTVSSIQTIRVQFFLPETDYIVLARILDIKQFEEAPTKREDRADVQLILADGSMYDEIGHIDFIDRNVDASTGSMLVQASFPNPNSLLRPGMYTKVRIELTVAEGALLVPQRCVTELQGRYSVYVVDDSNVVRAQQVKAATRIDDFWLIEEGLEHDDKVVISGLQKVAAGATVNPTVVEFESKSNQ